MLPQTQQVVISKISCNVESETTSVKFVLCSIKLHSLAKVSWTWNGSYICVYFLKNLVIWKILVDRVMQIFQMLTHYIISKSHIHIKISPPT